MHTGPESTCASEASVAPPPSLDVQTPGTVTVHTLAQLVVAHVARLFASFTHVDVTLAPHASTQQLSPRLHAQ
jgi:hypothetical protein